MPDLRRLVFGLVSLARTVQEGDRNLLDLVCLLLADESEMVVRQGALQDYVEHEERLAAAFAGARATASLARVPVRPHRGDQRLAVRGSEVTQATIRGVRVNLSELVARAAAGPTADPDLLMLCAGCGEHAK